MRRAADLYVIGASIAGAVFVFAYTLFGSTPPDWVLLIVLTAILLILVAVVYRSRAGQNKHGAG